jgi:hypothetical protein
MDIGIRKVNCRIDDICLYFGTMSFIDDFHKFIQGFHTCFYFRSASYYLVTIMILMSSYMILHRHEPVCILNKFNLFLCFFKELLLLHFQYENYME